MPALERTCADTELAVIGAGRLGLAVTRLALAAGMTVRVAGSGTPVRTRQVVAMFAPGAHAVRLVDLRDADLVLLATPLSAIDELDPDALEGKIVIDAMNYWPETDGIRPEFDDALHPTSTLVAARFGGAQAVVKALNHVGFRDLEAGAKPPGSPYRIGMGVAGEDPGGTVAAFIACLGFDPVMVGALADSRVLEPRGPVFGAAVPAAQLRARIAAAR